MPCGSACCRVEARRASSSHRGGSSAQYYELRWPRITKASRADAEPLSLADLQTTAREAMQLDPEQTASQVIADLFNWSRAMASPARPKETREEKYNREWRDWVRRLEQADGIFRTIDCASDLGRDAIQIDAQDSRPHRKTLPTCLRPGADFLATSEPPTTPPRRSHTVNELVTIVTPERALAVPSPSETKGRPRQIPLSASSPNLKLQSRMKRSPAPAETHDLGPDGSMSHKRPRRRSPGFELERRRFSCPTTLSSRSSSTPSLSSLIRTLLDPTCPGRPPERAESPFSRHSWSFFPPISTDQAPVTPLHPFLDSTNYLAIPLSVLWAAGIVPSSPAPTKVRQGWIFVARGREDEANEWARRATQTSMRTSSDRRGTRSETETVWLVREEALQTKSLGQLDGCEILSIL